MAKIGKIRDYYKHHIASLTGNLGRRGDKFLLGVDSQELVDYYYSKYKLPQISLLNGGKPKIIADEPSSTHDDSDSVLATIRFYVKEEDKIDLVLKFEDSQPSESQIISSDKNSFFIRTSLSLQNAEETIQNYEQLVLQLVNRKNTEVELGNKQFKEQLTNIITERKSKLKTQKDLIGQLSQIIPIVMKTKPSSPIVPLAKKKRIAINPPRPRISADPKIDPRILEAIMDVLFKGGRTFETAPETFAKLGEEDLRNILLSFLNGNFELRAVGEAFNKLGKADISLLYSGNNLFVTECKYWGGSELYSKTIDQLFRYLTWRENIGVLITFVREKDFTSIIRKSKEATCSHGTFIPKSMREKGASYYITRHLFPEDKEKSIEIHHLLFTIHSPR